MSWIVKRALKLFLKDTGDGGSTSVRLMRGEVSLRAVALDEQVLQYFLGLPRNYVLRGVQCGVLHVRVPWMRLRHEPVVVRIEHLCAEIAELAPGTTPSAPEVPSKLAEWLAGVSSKDKNKKKQSKKKKGKKKKGKKKKDKSGKDDDDDDDEEEEGTEQEQDELRMEGMSAPKKKKVVQSMLEAALDGLQVDIVGVLVTVAFAGGVLAPCATAAEHARAARRALPCATLAVGGATVRSVDARRAPTDQQRAYREATAADGTFTLRKELAVTDVELALGRDRVLAVPAAAVLLTARRRPCDFVASAATLDATVPAVTVAFPGLAWHNLLGIVSDVRWSAVHAVAAASTGVSTDGSNHNSNSGEARLAALRHGLDITDPLLSTSDATTVSESEATESVLGDDDSDNGDSDSEDVFGTDERQQQLEDIDIEALTRELGVDLGEASAPRRSVKKGKQAARQIPEIQYSVYVNKITLHLPRVLGVALTGLRVASTVELKPDDEKDEEKKAPGGGARTQRRRRRDQFITSQVSSLALAAAAVSVDPGDASFDEAAATTFRLRGDARAAYLVEGTVEYRRFPRNRRPAETTVDLRVADVALVPRFADLRRAHRFFAAREWCSPPPAALAQARAQAQKQQKGEEEGDVHDGEEQQQREEEQEEQQGNGKSDKWVERLTVHVATGDLLVGTELDSHVQICAHCKGVRVDGRPSARAPQAEFEPEISAARTETLTVVETPAVVAEEEEEDNKRPFQEWNVKVSDLWMGMELLTSGERWYITEPFSLTGDFVVFDPVGVLHAFQKKKGTAGATPAPLQQPAISGTISLEPIVLTLRQSVFTAAQHLFDFLMGQLEAALREVERVTEARRSAAAAASVREEQMPARKRLLALRRAVAQRLGGPAGVRVSAAYTLARLDVALATSNTSVGTALTRMDTLAASGRHVGLELLSQVLRDLLLLEPASGTATVLPEKHLVRATLRRVSGTVVTAPPPPPTVGELVARSVRPAEPLPGTVPAEAAEAAARAERAQSLSLDAEEADPDLFPREAFPDLDREPPHVVFTLACSDYFIKADFAPAVPSLLALRPRRPSDEEQQQEEGDVERQEQEMGGKKAPEMIREKDLRGSGELRLTLRHWQRERVYLDRVGLAVSGAEACMRGVFPNQIVRVVHARNAEVRRNKNAFVRALAEQRSTAGTTTAPASAPAAPEPGTAAAVALEQRFYATRFVAVEVEAADVAFQHTMPFDAPRTFTRVRAVPLGAGSLGALRSRVGAYLAAVDRANAAALDAAYTQNAELSRALADAHAALAVLKVERATLLGAADEHAHALALQRRALAQLEARNAQLVAELELARAQLAKTGK